MSFAGLLPGSLLLLAWIHSCLIKGVARQMRAVEEERTMYRDCALKDALTGAYSRLYYEMKDGQGRHAFLADMYEPLTVILIDIDGFKYINDSYGHLEGDKVLQHIVHAIQENITENDRLIRYGGDEFLLVLSSCDERKSDLLMTKVDQSINDNTVKTPIGLSYGIYRLDLGENLEAAVGKADKIMYTKKRLKKK